jgi:FixJ family two-component response regulator
MTVDASPALIAVVDDEESVLRAIKRLLSSAGLNVNIFSNGQAFLETLSVRRPDCVVLDLHMPGMSGFEIQSEMLRAGYSLSGGALAYLRKPVQAKLLLDAISSAITLSQEDSELL